jgi:large subunit ribosomal protein L17
MRHLKNGRHLNRTSAHRKALLRNLVSGLFEHGKIITTSAKAKEAKPFAEKMITLAKKGTLAARRQVLAELRSRQIVAGLFEYLGPRYAERHGGYCRILHLPMHRIGDGADQVVFELVEGYIGE